MPEGQEVPDSNATCETINVRGAATIGGLAAVGSLTVGGAPVTPGGVITGVGSPVGVRNDAPGTVYMDTTAGDVWVKIAAGAANWRQFAEFDLATGALSLGARSLSDFAANLQGFFSGQVIAAAVPGPGLFSGGWSFQGTLTPAPLPAGVTNDYNPGFITTQQTAVMLQATNAAGSELTGLVDAGLNMRVMVICLGPGPLIVRHNNVGSLAGNRFALPGAADAVLVPGAAMEMWSRFGMIIAAPWNVLLQS